MTQPKDTKVPAVTLGFWVIKIVATTLGEVGGNAVTMTMKLGYLLGSVLFVVPLVASVAAQIRAKRFHASLYWTTITLSTLAGTTLADFFDCSLGIGYLGGSLSLLTLVLTTLGAWRWSLGSVDVETVATPKAEAFYWTTIVFSQTLGTALGDWLADGGLGYNGSALLIAVVLALLAVLHFLTKVSPTFLFWAAFILTRPLGATLANSLDKPVAKGGLAVSDITASVVLVVILIVCLLVIPQRPGRQKSIGRVGSGADSADECRD